ncbi:MAG: MerR family transcriptional regulator [Candidatus Omnitrophota bacterium]|nr:MerR family transcriptional regulator [Candidatus Omnitrophota bacterium]NLE92066.1 MerR family transcriptional regulator [Elusimicrobiota bacterium]
MMKKEITAQEVVRKFNIPYHTLNYYTAMGLLQVLAKSGNQRMYEEKEVRSRLRRINALSKEGYPLHLIRKKIVGI